MSMFAATFEKIDALFVVEARSFGSRTQRYQEIDARFHLTLNTCGESLIVDFVIFERSEQRRATSC